MTRLPIPLIGEACNRCGECCRHGGTCSYRHWNIEDDLALNFIGKCEKLQENEDGTTTCLAIAAMDTEAWWFKKMVPGTCNYGTCENPVREGSPIPVRGMSL